MRFSVWHILLLFPAYFLAILSACLLDSSLVHPRYVYAINGAREVELAILHAREIRGGVAISNDVLNQWLAGTLPAEELTNSGLGEFPDVDPWGQPYAVVDNDHRDMQVEQRVSVYSLGRDGISESVGNDPDDINNWERNSYLYYEREMVLNGRIQTARTAIWLTFLTYPGLLACLWITKRFVRYITTARIDS